MTEQKHTIAFILPHPDDEALALGLPAELSAMGQEVHLISLTKGDLGSHTITARRRIARIRKREFQQAAIILGGTTTILPFHDGDLPFVKKKAARRLLRELRDVKADVVITTDTNDYHDDHIAAHEIARWATFHMSDGPIKTRSGMLGKRIPPTHHSVSFYSMDTQGSQRWANIDPDDGIGGENLHPVNTILSISEESLLQSLAAFKQHRSQLSEREDRQLGYVKLARRGAARRGKQLESPFAVGLNLESFGGYAFSTQNTLVQLWETKRRKTKLASLSL